MQSLKATLLCKVRKGTLLNEVRSQKGSFHPVPPDVKQRNCQSQTPKEYSSAGKELSTGPSSTDADCVSCIKSPASNQPPQPRGETVITLNDNRPPTDLVQNDPFSFKTASFFSITCFFCAGFSHGFLVPRCTSLLFPSKPILLVK